MDGWIRKLENWHGLLVWEANAAVFYCFDLFNSSLMERIYCRVLLYLGGAGRPAS
jgi:hypothetical protein